MLSRNRAYITTIIVIIHRMQGVFFKDFVGLLGDNGYVYTPNPIG